LKFDFIKEGSISNSSGAGTGVFGIPGTTTSLQGLLLSKTDIDSAYNYLKRVNKPYYAEIVDEFQKQLKYLQDNKPWYIQSVSGAGDLIKIPPPGQTWRGKDKVLTIECLESLDMQMSFIADLYRKFVYDMWYKRYNLPIDKRRFNCKLIVSEIRNLRTVGSVIEEGNKILQAAGDSGTSMGSASGTIAGASNQGPDTPLGSLSNDLLNKVTNFSDRQVSSLLNLTKSLDENLTFLVFFLYNCEFVFDEYSYLETLSNSVIPEPATFRFKIKIGDIIEDNQYGYWNWLLSDTKYSASPTKIMDVYLQSFNDRKLDWVSLVKRNPGGGDLFENAMQGKTDAINELMKGKSTDFADLAKYYGNMAAEVLDAKIAGNPIDLKTIQTLKAQAGFQIYKNVYHDMTQGTVGTNERLTLPPSAERINVYEPMEAEKSVQAKLTKNDLLYEAIRIEKENEIPRIEHPNIGGGYERSDSQIAQDKKEYDQKFMNGETKNFKDQVFINVYQKDTPKVTEINADTKTYNENSIVNVFPNIKADDKSKKGEIQQP
jgi:hypothetical protein